MEQEGNDNQNWELVALALVATVDLGEFSSIHSGIVSIMTNNQGLRKLVIQSEGGGLREIPIGSAVNANFGRRQLGFSNPNSFKPGIIIEFEEDYLMLEFFRQVKGFIGREFRQFPNCLERFREVRLRLGGTSIFPSLEPSYYFQRPVQSLPMDFGFRLHRQNVQVPDEPEAIFEVQIALKESARLCLQHGKTWYQHEAGWQNFEVFDQLNDNEILSFFEVALSTIIPVSLQNILANLEFPFDRPRVTGKPKINFNNDISRELLEADYDALRDKQMENHLLGYSIAGMGIIYDSEVAWVLVDDHLEDKAADHIEKNTFHFEPWFVAVPVNFLEHSGKPAMFQTVAMAKQDGVYKEITCVVLLPESGTVFHPKSRYQALRWIRIFEIKFSETTRTIPRSSNQRTLKWGLAFKCYAMPDVPVIGVSDALCLARDDCMFQTYWGHDEPESRGRDHQVTMWERRDGQRILTIEPDGHRYDLSPMKTTYWQRNFLIKIVTVDRQEWGPDEDHVISLEFESFHQASAFLRKIKGYIGPRNDDARNMTQKQRLLRRFPENSNVEYENYLARKTFHPIVLTAVKLSKTFETPPMLEGWRLAHFFNEFWNLPIFHYDEEAAIEQHFQMNDFEIEVALKRHQHMTLRLKNCYYLFEEPFNVPHPYMLGQFTNLMTSELFKLDHIPRTTIYDFHSYFRAYPLTEVCKVAMLNANFEGYDPAWIYLLEWDRHSVNMMIRLTPCLIVFPYGEFRKSNHIRTFISPGVIYNWEEEKWKAVELYCTTCERSELTNTAMFLRVYNFNSNNFQFDTADVHLNVMWAIKPHSWIQ